MTTLLDALEAGPVVLDGGFATQLEAQGQDLSSDLWSARLLRDDPGQIVAAHRAFLDAGARVIETATYQASFEGFSAIGLNTVESAALLASGADLARQAIESFRTDGNTDDVWVAASIGPYGAILSDGSEYTGAYDLSIAELQKFHARRLAVIAESDVDVLAFETVPKLDEVIAIVEASADTDVPTWISISATGTTTRHGESLAEAFEIAATAPHVFALGVNCVSPHDAAAAVRIAAEYGKPVVVYPNSGEGWSAETRDWFGSGGFEPAQVNGWVESGARLIGGCCRVRPAHISAIAAALG